MVLLPSSVSTLLAELVNNTVDFLVVIALRVLGVQPVEGQPRLIVLILVLHLVEVHVQVVLLCVLVPEVQLHPCVVAVLQFLLQAPLVVVEIFVEVGQLLVSDFQLVHAVAEDHALGCLLVQTLFVAVLAHLRSDDELHGVFCGVALAVEVDVREHF